MHKVFLGISDYTFVLCLLVHFLSTLCWMSLYSLCEGKIMQNAQTYIHMSLKYFVTRYYDQILLVPSSKSRISKRAIKMVECNPSFSCLSAQFALSGNCKRRALVLGMGALTLNPLQASPLLAEGVVQIRYFIQLHNSLMLMLSGEFILLVVYQSLKRWLYIFPKNDDFVYVFSILNIIKMDVLTCNGFLLMHVALFAVGG